jgi:hypothetical protein
MTTVELTWLPSSSSSSSSSSAAGLDRDLEVEGPDGLSRRDELADLPFFWRLRDWADLGTNYNFKNIFDKNGELTDIAPSMQKKMSLHLLKRCQS